MLKMISVDKCPLTPKYRALFLKHLYKNMREMDADLPDRVITLMMESFNQGLDLGATMTFEALHIRVPGITSIK